jgi:hypothetical protein
LGVSSVNQKWRMDWGCMGGENNKICSFKCL